MTALTPGPVRGQASRIGPGQTTNPGQPLPRIYAGNPEFPNDFRHDWRRGWDSNPRWACTHNGFRDRPDRPLRHLSDGGGLAAGPPRGKPDSSAGRSRHRAIVATMTGSVRRLRIWQRKETSKGGAQLSFLDLAHRVAGKLCHEDDPLGQLEAGQDRAEGGAETVFGLGGSF